MKRAVFVGRWSPFHMGHLEIMKDKIKAGIPLLILIRNTPYDVYPPQLRKRMIESTMRLLKIDAKVDVIDDIESINYGRGVGYNINEVIVPENIKRISATEIRKKISKKDNSWKKFIPAGANKILETYLKEKGIVVWFTGIPRSGKSEIAKLVNLKLEKVGIISEIINSKELRKTISKELKFTKKDRIKNLQNAKYVAGILSKNKGIVLCSFITPYEKERMKIKKDLEKNSHYVEVYVKSSIKVAEKRDPKLFEKAKKGTIKEFTGISSPYEEPTNPNIILNTDNENFNNCANKIVEYIKSLI